MSNCRVYYGITDGAGTPEASGQTYAFVPYPGGSIQAVDEEPEGGSEAVDDC